MARSERRTVLLDSQQNMEDRYFIRNLEELIDFSSENPLNESLGKTDSFSCSLICMKKGSSIADHVYTGHSCMQMLRGAGTCEIVGPDGAHEATHIKAGSFIYLPPNLLHSLHCEEDSAFLLCTSHPYY